jgi:hypothetical protein
MEETINSQKKDLLKFIDKEIKNINNGDIDLNKIYKFFYKCLYKSYNEIYYKIKDIKTISVDDSIRSGINMVYNIFWTLYSYTYNVKLTMFLTERAVLLYTEFVVMSRNPILNKEFRFIPNINDAIAFAIKKTIGPIKLSYLKQTKKFFNKLSNYKSASFIIKHLFLNIIKNTTEQPHNYVNDNLEIIMNHLSIPILNNCKLINKDYLLFNKITNITDNVKEDKKKLFYIKLFLELSNMSMKKKNTISNCNSLLNNLLSENFDCIIINEETIKNIKKKSFFKNLLILQKI